MSLIAAIVERLSGVAVLEERLAETNRNVDRSLTWRLEHEKRSIRLEAAAPPVPAPAPRLSRK